MRRIRLGSLAVLAGVIALLVGVLTPATAAGATRAPYCGLVWGSLPESSAASTAGLAVTDVRAGRHACFDRLVVDLRGPAAATGYSVRYVDAVHQEGSGTPVPLAGGAALQVVVDAPAYDASGRATYLPPSRGEVVDVDGFRTVEQVAWAGSFEGRTTLGVGTRARLPFRTFTLLGAPGDDDAVRLVIDVAHRW
ncbi:AMIN-like domain-containing (lipo)protein [Blastococcus sp. SYSU DS0828]